MKNNSIVLTYHDSLLRESDVHLLKGSHWLNDTIIGFYMEYLSHEMYPGCGLLFISPEVTQCLKESPRSEQEIFLDPLYRDHSFVFFPLNNNEAVDYAGGTHWSLLVYSRNQNMFFHFDSSTGTNYSAANKLALKIHYYFNKSLDDFQIVEVSDCLQQDNSYDCGIYLLCFIDHLAKEVLRHGELNDYGIMDRSLFQNKRSELLSLINGLRGN